MARNQGTITELVETGEGWAIQIRLQSTLNFLPGQYFRAATAEESDVLPHSLFPIRKEGLQLTLRSVRDGRWQVGQEIHLRGPLGSGFQLPAGVEHVGLISFGAASAAVLLPLAANLLAEGKEVALATASPLQGLPPALEVWPIEQVQEVVAWADAAAISALRTDLEPLLEQFHRNGPHKVIEVLLQTDMPCGGVAACGVCAVSTKKGWKLTCKDGPVFKLGELIAE